MSEINITGTVEKVQIIDGGPPCQPGCCAMCGSTTGRFIDFGLQLDWYGAVYFCWDCITQIANALEYINQAQWKPIKAYNDELRVINNNLLDQNEALRNELASMGSVRDLINASTRSVDSVDEEPEATTVEPIDDDGDGEEGEAGPPEQDDESGLPDVQRDDSIDALFADL